MASCVLSLQDKLLLEPYGHHRNIAYVVVAPDNEFILSALRVFLRHLSCAYEQCRLGRHLPISNKLRDGVLRVSKAVTEKLGETTKVDNWFTDIGEFVYCLIMMYP